MMILLRLFFVLCFFDAVWLSGPLIAAARNNAEYRILCAIEADKCKPFGCSFCVEGFFGQKSLRRHEAKYHAAVLAETMAKKARGNGDAIGDFVCDMCGHAFLTAEGLADHDENGHLDIYSSGKRVEHRSFSCQYPGCHEIFDCLTALVGHVPEHRIKAGGDGFCGVPINTADRLMASLEAAQEEPQPEDEEGDTQVGVVLEGAQIDEEIVNRYHLVCGHVGCSRVFYQQNHLTLHRKWHERQDAAVTGSDVGENAAVLILPAQDVVAIEADETFPCDACDQVFKTHRGLATHVSRAHKTGQYRCGFPRCLQLFDDLTHWINHVQSHVQVVAVPAPHLASTAPVPVVTVPEPEHEEQIMAIEEFNVPEVQGVEHAGEAADVTADLTVMECFACDECSRNFPTSHGLGVHKGRTHTRLRVSAKASEPVEDAINNIESASNVPIPDQVNSVEMPDVADEPNLFEGSLSSASSQSDDEDWVPAINRKKRTVAMSAVPPAVDADAAQRAAGREDILDEIVPDDNAHPSIITENFECDECLRQFRGLHGLSVHRGRAHKKAKTSVAAKQTSDVGDAADEGGRAVRWKYNRFKVLAETNTQTNEEGGNVESAPPLAILAQLNTAEMQRVAHEGSSAEESSLSLLNQFRDVASLSPVAREQAIVPINIELRAVNADGVNNALPVNLSGDIAADEASFFDNALDTPYDAGDVDEFGLSRSMMNVLGVEITAVLQGSPGATAYALPVTTSPIDFAHVFDSDHE